MSEYLVPNLQCLAQYQPILAERVAQYLSAEGLTEIERDDHGRWNIRTAEGGWLYKDRAWKQLDTLPAQLETLEHPQVLLWVGLGLGYHLDRATAQTATRTQFHVVVEPSWKFFCAYLQSDDRQAALQRSDIKWVIGQPDEKLAHAFDILLRDQDFRATCHLCSTINLRFHAGHDHAVLEAWHEMMHLHNAANMIIPIDDHVGMRYFVQNLDIIAQWPWLEAARGTCAGMPGIVVSAGPSLEQSLPSLKAVQNNAVIFGGDSVSPLLREQGIHPHILGCLERKSHAAASIARGTSEDTILVTSPVVHPSAYEHHRGPNLLLPRSHQYAEWFDPSLEMIHTGMASVSHLGLFVLWYLGCDPIYLVGQDLAFDPHTQQSHTAGHSRRQDKAYWEAQGEARMQLPGHAGQPVETITTFHKFWHLFTQMISVHQMPCQNVIPADYGVAIPGAPQCEPEIAFAKLDTPIDLSALRKAASKLSPEVQTQRRTYISERVTSTADWLRSVVTQGAACCHQIFDFVAEHPPEHVQHDKPAYAKFFQTVEQQSAQLMTGVLYDTFLRGQAHTRHLHLAERSAELLGRPLGEQLAWDQLDIPVAWQAEIMTRARMSLWALEQTKYYAAR